VAKVPDGMKLVMVRETAEPPIVVTQFSDGKKYIFDNRIPGYQNFFPGKAHSITNNEPGQEMKVYFVLRPGQNMEQFKTWISANDQLTYQQAPQIPSVLKDDE
jgi:hypothetical protein